MIKPASHNDAIYTFKLPVMKIQVVLLMLCKQGFLMQLILQGFKKINNITTMHKERN